MGYPVLTIHDCFGVSVKDSIKVKQLLFTTYKHMYQKTDIIDNIHHKLINTLKEYFRNNLSEGVIGYDNEEKNSYIIIYNYQKNTLKYLKDDMNYDAPSGGIKK